MSSLRLLGAPLLLVRHRLSKLPLARLVLFRKLLRQVGIPLLLQLKLGMQIVLAVGLVDILTQRAVLR